MAILASMWLNVTSLEWVIAESWLTINFNQFSLVFYKSYKDQHKLLERTYLASKLLYFISRGPLIVENWLTSHFIQKIHFPISFSYKLYNLSKGLILTENLKRSKLYYNSLVEYSLDFLKKGIVHP